MKATTEHYELLTVGAVADFLGLSEQRVRQLADAGALPVIRATGGLRLFGRADVERLKRDRAKTKQAAA